MAFREPFPQRRSSLGDEARLGRRYEDLFDPVARLRRAFHVLVGSDGVGHLSTLVGGHRPRLPVPPRGVGGSLGGGARRSQVLLQSDEDDRNVRTEMTDFRFPLVLDILEADWIADAEADENDVSVRIRQRPTKTETRR